MFAFCPTLNREICGLPTAENNYDMTILAEGQKKSVESLSMRYISTGSQTEREFDACYYLI